MQGNTDRNGAQGARRHVDPDHGLSGDKHLNYYRRGAFPMGATERNPAMSFPKKHLATTAAAFFLIGASSLPAFAGNPVQCAGYANQAVQQQAVNLQNQCGYTGARWQSDYNAHFLWCVTAPNSAIYGERNARIAMLASCGGGGGPPPPPAVIKFWEPKIGGLRLDWCKVWADQCGPPAANAYCQTKGYSHATSFAKASDIGAFAPTRVIGTGQVCSDAFCDGFAWINCAN
jgi:hypothetical protein